MRVNPESPPFEAIEQAFQSVWNIYPRRARQNAQSHELKVDLSRTLIALVADGITDAEELRSRALKQLLSTRQEDNEPRAACLQAKV